MVVELQKPEQEIKLTKGEFLDILNRARTKVSDIEISRHKGTAHQLTIDVINRTVLAVRNEVLDD